MFGYLTLPLIVFALSMALTALVLRRDPRSPAHRIFALFFMAMGAWGILIFGMRASPDLARAYFWEKAVFPAIAFTAVFYYHFTLAYTGVRRVRGLLPAAYVFALAVTVLSPAGVLATGMQIKPYGYAPVITPTFYFFFLGSDAFAILGILNLARAYRLSRVYHERNRYLYLIIAASLTILGGIFDVLPVLGLPAYPGAIIANTAFCLLTGVAVLRYRLLDIRIVIRRGLAYFLLSALVAMPYMGIIFLFHRLLGQAVPTWGYLILLLALAPTLRPLWQRIQDMVDRWFYRERFDVFRELEDFSQETHSVGDLNQTASSLVMLLKRALRASSVLLLLPSSSGDFQVTSSAGEAAPALSLGRDNPLLRRLQSERRLLKRYDLETIDGLQGLTALERDGAGGIQGDLFAPLTTKEGELAGVLILGEKLSQQPYSTEDERLVLTVASRMAVELENARLYALERSMRRELQRQDEQKTEFLHSVAHELKTPLTGIISSSDLLGSESSSASPELRERLLANINRSAWLMNKRVGELVDLARIQIGSLELELEPGDIGQLVRDVAWQLSSLFENKRQSLDLNIANQLPLVRLDRERLEQVLLNLLSNANKFSPTAARVAVEAKQRDGEVVVAVGDSAATISENDRARLFDPYYRGGSDADRQRVPGLGLGLAISRRIVELHRGKIWVESQAGQGNTFILSLPIWQGKPGETDRHQRVRGKRRQS